MASKTEICNMALCHVGGKTVSDVDSEASAEAIACRTFYNAARDSLLRAHQWPFATKVLSLSLITTNPTDTWSYSYAYPADCLKFIKIVSEGYYTYAHPYQNIEAVQRVAHEIYRGMSGAEIYTNQDDAVGKYVSQVTETGRFPSDFTIALSYALASMIAPKVVGSDNFAIKQLVSAMHKEWMGIAAAASYNEEVEAKTDESSFTRARI